MWRQWLHIQVHVYRQQKKPSLALSGTKKIMKSIQTTMGENTALSKTVPTGDMFTRDNKSL